ncbi:MAG: helix-turn-helix domain-containing protein [Elusimicrobiota bacterium]
MELDDGFNDACALAWSVPREWARASLGEKLRYLRGRRDMSQRHLADDSGVAQALISRLEAGGDALWSVWRRLFDALGYEPLLIPFPTSEEAEDFIREEIQRRQERAEAGRLSRWG